MPKKIKIQNPKKIKIQNPFRVSVYRGESPAALVDAYSFKKRADAVNKVAEILPDYFDKPTKKQYQYRIALTHLRMTRKGVKSKKLLNITQ